MEHAAVRAVLDHYLTHSAAGDETAAHSIYLDDAVLEFPQSGERFEGVAAFLPWRSRYPARVEYQVRRLRGAADVWIAELLFRYDGGPWQQALDILEFRGDKVAAESIYVFEGWDAPDWRARWWAAPPQRPGAEPPTTGD
ncbi:nuclear transport factor 2 family protein [Blastococcus sp. TF02-09]|uniref:nuclear transport factor 2 family protein n=1 Tax=Blastococcus sp. TF02-09 TaxID=2250576 RepID=UPI000DEAB941|nr:nuclear transport factor 2 family protein [Blastococcus sp. TF02-9]